MEDNSIQLLASKFVNQTAKNIFLTGKAGTGKTTFLKKIISSSHKKTVVVAPTGIAAINAGGTTIHSLFQLPFGSFIPTEINGVFLNENSKLNTPSSVIKNLQMSDSKRKLLREIELLIIDEVSMLRADLLDAIDLVLRFIRRQNFEQFGGVQVLFIGDLQQLPPVINDAEWAILKTYYKSPFFFDARVFEKEKPVYIELEKIYRQSDEQFIHLLNNLRNNTVSKADEDLLNQYYKPNFKAQTNDNYITLTTHNYKANNLNKQKLNELAGSSYFFDAVISGDFNENSFPLDKTLELKVGAQVMFVKNDTNTEKRFFNGKIGIVTQLTESTIEVEFNDNTKPIKVEKHEWQNIKYKLNTITNEIEEDLIGSFSHFPIKLAWAITVHKSQGLTFEKAIIDVEDAFAPGQIYVALSRLTSLNGLVLNSRINFQSLHLNKEVADYNQTKSNSEKLNEIISLETLTYTKSYVINSFDFNYLEFKLKQHSESYSKDTKKSAKQKYADWAKNIFQDFSDIKENSDKFRSQLDTIFTKNNTDLFEHVHQRIESAVNYFMPLLKKISSKIITQIELLKEEKKVKAYANELLELELDLFEQIKKINKAKTLIKTIIENKEFNNDITTQLIADVTRPSNETIFNAISDKKQKTDAAPVKTDTKLETLHLYYDGKNMFEIAEIRKLTVATIENHVAYYIAKGELNVSDFVPSNKLESIIEAYKKAKSFKSNDIKKLLPDEYTFGEIKLVLASIVSPDKI